MKRFRYAISKNGYCTLQIVDADDWGGDYIGFLFHSLQLLGFSEEEYFLYEKTGFISLAKSFYSLKELDKGQLNKISNYYWGVEVKEVSVLDM